MGEEEESSQIAHLVFPCIAVSLSLVVDVFNKKNKLFRVPDSVLLFLMSVFINLVAQFLISAQLALHFKNTYLWYTMKPDTLLGILLPPLLFESAFKVNMPHFLFRIRTIVFLTIFAYVFSAAFSSALYFPVLNISMEWDIFLVLLFVSILVATDPVAVVAILESMGAPLRLRILVEGESLLNDGLAIFSFKFFLLLFNQDKSTNGLGMFLYLTRCLLISPVVGITCGILISWVLGHVHDNKRRQVVLIIAVYIAFQICDHIGSGALGMVCMGLALAHQKESMAPETTEMAVELWGCIAYIANAIIFVFAGSTVASEMFETGDSPGEGALLYVVPTSANVLSFISGFSLAPVTLLARSVAIIFFYQCVSRLSRGHRKPSPSDYALLSFGGVRGALGLILALEFRNEMKEDPIKSLFGRQVLIATCSSTFFSLVVQGTLFSTFAEAEEKSKRSLYMEESNRKLYFYMKKKANELMGVMESNNEYLVGTNWRVVRQQIRRLFAHSSIAPKMEEPAKRHLPMLEDDEETVRTYGNEDEMDVRGGFFNCLLWRVHSAWEGGAISGRTAHVIVTLMEHGIDEGGLTLMDFNEHLDAINAPWIIIKLADVFRCVSMRLFPVLNFTMLSRSETFAVSEVHPIRVPRTFEKWFLFIFVLSFIHSCILTTLYMDFDDSGVNLRMKILFASTVLSSFGMLEKGYFFVDLNAHRQRQAKTGEHQKRIIVEMSIHLIFLLLHLTMLLCSVSMLLNGECISSTPGHCHVLMTILMTVSLLCTVYRLLRGLPITLFTLNEYLRIYIESRERVRLSVLHYLHHMSGQAKISKDLFTGRAFVVVRKEQRNFNKTIDALLRSELKKDASFGALVPVIKTRQAIRMLSTEICSELVRLKGDGLLREDSEWPPLVKKLRGRAELVLSVPPLAIKDWLATVPWIRNCSLSTRTQLLSIFENAMSTSERVQFEPHSAIETGGKRMIFVLEGVCKVREWVQVGVNRGIIHHSYVAHGQFVGERNLVMYGRKDKPFQIKWPRIRYESITRMHGIFVEAETIEKIVGMTFFADILPNLAQKIQIQRMKVEVKHLERQFEEMDNATFNGDFAVHGAHVGSEERIRVPDKKVAVIGCFTEITYVAPGSALQPLTFHIKGPATMRVKPVREAVNGMVLIRRDLLAVDESQRPGAASSTEDNDKSVMSITLQT